MATASNAYERGSPEHLSRKLTQILRYEYNNEQINMQDGWVAYTNLMTLPDWDIFSVQMLDKVIRNDDMNRYQRTIWEGEYYVRAARRRTDPHVSESIRKRVHADDDPGRNRKKMYIVNRVTIEDLKAVQVHTEYFHICVYAYIYIYMYILFSK